MNVNGKIEGDKLVITIDIGAAARKNAIVSKSAAEKAAKLGLPEPKATLLATTGGFTGFGDIKLSLNAMIG